MEQATQEPRVIKRVLMDNGEMKTMEKIPFVNCVIHHARRAMVRSKVNAAIVMMVTICLILPAKVVIVVVQFVLEDLKRYIRSAMMGTSGIFLLEVLPVQLVAH